MWNTQEQAAAYLAALIDGEGGVCLSKRCRYIYIDNSDIDILRAGASACDLLEITYCMRENPKASTNLMMYCLHIYGKDNLEVVRDLVPLKCVRKMDRVITAINSFQRKMKKPTTKVYV